MIRVNIGGKSKSLLSHLTTEAPAEQTNELQEKWEQEDLIVFSWLIQNIEPTIAGNLTEYPTAKHLWDALVVTYSSGRDKLQTFNLHVKANEIKQNNKSLEDLWILLQGVWGEIGSIDLNPMRCPEDIKRYTNIRSEQKLFQFLNALDRRYDHIKREILRLDPLPSAEAAYSMVRKEAAHQEILGAANTETQGITTGLVTSETDGLGLVSKNNRRIDRTSTKVDKTKLKCTECGMTGHTKDGCFRVIGYPDWWNNNPKRRRTSGFEKSKPTATETTAENHTGFGGAVTGSPSREDKGFTTGYQDGGDHWV